MSSTKQGCKRAKKKQHPAAKMSADQMIEAGYLVPAGIGLERGKVYVIQVTHTNDCPLPDGAGDCTCQELIVEQLEYISEGRVDA